MSDHTEAVDEIKKTKDTLDKLQTSSYDKLKNPNKAHPDARWHLRISLAKSLIRIAAGSVLCMGEFFIAGSLLVLAETLGIVEELV